MKHLKAFSVVEFPPDRQGTRSTVEAVPSKWITQGQDLCHWPKDHVHVLVKDSESVPTEHWETYSISRIFSTHDTYQEANKAANHYERCSDAESESENYQRPKRFRVGTTSSKPSELLSPSYNLPPSSLYGLPGPHFELVSAVGSTINASQTLSTNEFRQLIEEPLNTSPLPPPPTPKSSQTNRRKVNLFPSQSEPHSSFSASSYLSEAATVQALQSPGLGSAVQRNELIWPFGQPPSDDEVIIQPINQSKRPKQQTEINSATPARNASDKSFETVIIRQLAKLEANQKEMLKTLNSLVVKSNHSSGEADRESFASLPQFPIPTEAELKSFDDFLTADDNLELAIKYFAQIGGLSKEQVVREILKRLLSREIALSISFTGKGKGNISFSQFSLVWCMILNSTRRNKVSSLTSETEIRKICMDYFRFLRPSPSSSTTGPSA